ncbi:MAG: CDP-alcohol phosphatidyltransferase family protein [Methanotrichaceae archaeon]
MTLDGLRNKSKAVAEPFAAVAQEAGITPNQLSVLSLIFGVASAVFYYLSSFSSSKGIILFMAALMVLLNALTDMVDGALARMTGSADQKGDLLDHVIDRYADILILSGIVFAGYAPWPVGFLAVAGVLLTSYIGTQAQAINLGRYYGGMMGRADRLTAIIVTTFANAIYADKIEGLALLGWLVVWIMLSSHITALQRFGYIWKRL